MDKIFYEKQPFNMYGFCYIIDHKEAECETIAAYLLQQQRGYLSSTVLLDPPSWTNPDNRGKRYSNQQANVKQLVLNNNNDAQLEAVQREEGTMVIADYSCMHANNNILNMMHFNVEVSKDMVSLSE